MKRLIVATAAALCTLASQAATWNLSAERLLSLTEREAVGQVLWTLRIPALKRPLQQRLRRGVADNRATRHEAVPYQLPHGGRGFATVVVNPLSSGGPQQGAVILFEDTTRTVALELETRELKGQLKK